MHGAVLASFSPSHPPLLPFPGISSSTSRTGLGSGPPPLQAQTSKVGYPIDLKSLPYSLDSLEPYISRQTMSHHWGGHQRRHVASFNMQMKESEEEEMKFEDVIVASYNKGRPTPLFNDAAQIWNHDFFWQSLKPGGGGLPSGDLLRLIKRDFGSFELLLKEFIRVASTQFGSGWSWLAYKANRLDVGNARNPFPSEEDNKLVVVKTPNAVNPLVWDYDPLLGIDLWEHAYCLDYENRIDDYVSAILKNLVSWEVVNCRLEVAIARAAERAREEKMESSTLRKYVIGQEGTQPHKSNDDSEDEDT